MKKKTVITTNTKAAAAKPFELVDGPGPRPKVLKTSDLPGGTRSTEIDDKNFIGINATPAELADLRGRIEARQAPAPAQADRVLVCDNPKCRAWSAYGPKEAARSVGGECLFCNPGTRHDGGHRRAATPAETEMFWADKKRREEIFKLRMKQQMEVERERSRLGLDRVGYLSIDNDPSIKKGIGR